MKTTIVSVLTMGLLLSVAAYAQDTTAAAREARRQVRQQKVERSKGELKEMGQEVGTAATELGRETKEKAKVAGKAVKREAKKTGETIDRKVDDRKARRAARRDTL